MSPIARMGRVWIWILSKIRKANLNKGSLSWMVQTSAGGLVKRANFVGGVVGSLRGSLAVVSVGVLWCSLYSKFLDGSKRLKSLPVPVLLSLSGAIRQCYFSFRELSEPPFHYGRNFGPWMGCNLSPKRTASQWLHIRMTPTGTKYSIGLKVKLSTSCFLFFAYQSLAFGPWNCPP